MTLTLAARHPELWRAAVDMFGPYDLFTFMDRLPETWKPYFALAVGDPEKDRDFLDRALAEDAHRRHRVPAPRHPGPERPARRRARVARRRRAAPRARARRRLPRLRGRGARRAEARESRPLLRHDRRVLRAASVLESLLGSRAMRWLSILVVALALVAAGCGGSDDESAASDETTVEETTDRRDDDRRDDDRGDDGHRRRRLRRPRRRGLPERSPASARRWRRRSRARRPTRRRRRRELRRVSRTTSRRRSRPTSRCSPTAFAEYARSCKDIGIEPGETPTAEQLQQLQAALAADQEELTAASQRLEAWSNENCLAAQIEPASAGPIARRPRAQPLARLRSASLTRRSDSAEERPGSRVTSIREGPRHRPRDGCVRVRDRPRKRRAPPGGGVGLLADVRAGAARRAAADDLRGSSGAHCGARARRRRARGVLRGCRRPHRALRRAGARRRARRGRRGRSRVR